MEGKGKTSNLPMATITMGFLFSKDQGWFFFTYAHSHITCLALRHLD
jgi:hypothetical protein